MDRFTKACLVLIIALLAVIALKPMIFPPSVAAQQHAYVAVRLSNILEPQAELNKYANEGWELTATYTTFVNSTSGAVLIFRK